ncbi:MAG: tRNA threonylcarbamoyladenosine dehydratase [Clostridia bacterium]|nr:tRNA threonylcarbamoyladenosine dehydratase [Clostridia bacterium]MBQ9993717.1 tRNA threonylcarbamoyladenosine dehydratase [Clostridia bacterium]
MPEEMTRTAIVLGEEAVSRLVGAKVAVFGIGGVGGYTVEALCRAGVGHFIIVDGDCVSRSNINRQIIALQDTVGRPKVEVMAERMRQINPAVRIDKYECFYDKETADSIPLEGCDCVVDAIDTVQCKLLLIERCQELSIPVISCMGAGNKLDPSRFEVADIYDTSMCPLARVMRKECGKRGIKSLRVVYSREEAAEPKYDTGERRHSGRPVPGSLPFCAPAAGLLAAAEAVRLILP